MFKISPIIADDLLKAKTKVAEDKLPADCATKFFLRECSPGGTGYVVVTPYTTGQKIGGHKIVAHTIIAWFVSEQWIGNQSEAQLISKFQLN